MEVDEILRKKILFLYQFTLIAHHCKAFPSLASKEIEVNFSPAFLQFFSFQIRRIDNKTRLVQSLKNVKAN